MVTQEQMLQGEELMNTLIVRAQESKSFKERLMSNPEATIQLVAGSDFNLPLENGIVIEDQSDDSIIYFNIPAKTNLDNFELTDEQLNFVNGGEFFLSAYAGLLLFSVCYTIKHNI